LPLRPSPKGYAGGNVRAMLRPGTYSQEIIHNPWTFTTRKSGVRFQPPADVPKSR
jgi:hypothetical protein